jgi:hypothetical protein
MTPQIILATVVLNLLAVFSAFGKTAPPVTFDSPCLAHGQHGVDRWTPKIDASPVPWNKSKIQPITPSGIYRWRGPGPNVPLTPTTETRIPSEQKWYALTGRVVDLRVEADGDIHVALKDATGNKAGTVGAEVPLGTRWCKFRKTLFMWTTRKFPFTFTSNRVLTILKSHRNHIITVIGKAFYDVDHAPANHSNRRTNQKGYAAWEIHPVRALVIVR